MLPRAAPCQQQDGHISAPDSQQQRHRAEQQRKRSAQLLNEVVVQPGEA